MPHVRGKFKVVEHARSCYSGTRVKLSAVYSDSPEDQTYAAATPSADIDMFVTSDEALEVLKLGRSFYVDFTAIEE